MSDQTPTPTDDSDDSKPERIAKRIARSGVCSRRDAERMIDEGLVKLNGKVLDSPAVTVTDSDEIYVNGKMLPQKEKPRLWRLFKKRGLVTSHRDEQGRDTVFEHLPSYMPRVISVGRLDLNSEGILLLTNDGELARYLELPATGWARRYRVRVHGRIDPAKLKQLADGVTVDGVHYGSIQAEVDVQKDSNAWMTVTLREGKNREIRRVMDHLGWPVTRLMRVSYGPFQLGNLAPGDCEEITGKVMKEQLAAFFKGDYSKVSEKKSVARGGTGRPKAPRTVFGQPAARRRPQGTNPNAVATDDSQTDSRPGGRPSHSGRPARPTQSERPGNRAKPAFGRGGQLRDEHSDRNDRSDRGDRDDQRSHFGGNDRATRDDRNDRADRGGRDDQRSQFGRNDRPARDDRNDRSDRGGRDDQRSHFGRNDRPARDDRNDRSDRGDRDDQRSHFDRNDRPARDDRNDRSDRGGRDDQRSHFGRNDRPARDDRNDRSDRGGRDDQRSHFGGNDRPARDDRNDRSDRGGRDDQRSHFGGNDRPARDDRNDRSDRGGRDDRSDRGGRDDQRSHFGGNDRPTREDRNDRSDRGSRDDRTDRNDRGPRFEDRDTTNRPTNKGRGRYAPGGKVRSDPTGDSRNEGRKPFGSRGKPGGNAGGRPFEKSGGKPSGNVGNNRGAIADGKPGNRPTGRSGSKPAGNRPRGKKG